MTRRGGAWTRVVGAWWAAARSHRGKGRASRCARGPASCPCSPSGYWLPPQHQAEAKATAWSSQSPTRGKIKWRARGPPRQPASRRPTVEKWAKHHALRLPPGPGQVLLRTGTRAQRLNATASGSQPGEEKVGRDPCDGTARS